MNLSFLFRFWLFGLAILLIFSFSQKAMAQTDTLQLLKEFKKLTSDDLIDIDKAEKYKVVSASRSNKIVEDLPVTIHVIRGEEIRKNGYTTLVDALKSVPGIRTSKLGSGDLGEMFLMRGLIGNSYCKILIDNIPIQPVVNGSLPIGEQLPIAQAEQIEVVFGPASAVYGAAAMAGVINIITKKPQDSEFAHINFTKGMQGYHSFNFLAGGKIGRNKNVLGYTIYGNQSKRDDLNFVNDDENYNTLNYAQEYFGIDTTETVIAQQEQLFERLTAAMPYYQGTILTPSINEMAQKSYLIGITLDYRNFQLTMQEMYRQDHSSLGKMPVLYSYANPNTFLGETIQRTTLSYTNQINSLNFQTNLSYLRYRMNPNSALATNYTGNSDNGVSYVYATSDDIFGEAFANYQLNDYIEISAGASFMHASSLPTINEQSTPFKVSNYHPFDSTYRPENPVFGNFGYYPTIRTNYGTFVQLFLTWRKWVIILGNRYDYTRGFEFHGYGRLAFLFKQNPRTTWRVSYGAAVRAPTPDEAYTSLGIKSVGIVDNEFVEGILYQRVPNPNLKPEQLRTTELGFRKRFSDKFDMESILQIQTVSQLITGRSVLLDTLLYPNAIAENVGKPIRVRQFYNDEFSASFLVEWQWLFRRKDLIKSIKLDADLSFKLAYGIETLPETEDIIEGAKMVPRRMMQLNISMQPHSKLYLRFESQWLSNWTRRHIANLKVFENHKYARIPGYFNLDLMTSYKLNRNLDIYFRVLNIFDTKYAGLGSSGVDVDLWYNPQLQRNIYFGINFNLN